MAKLRMAHASHLGQKMVVSSSYAKILGKQIFSLGSFPEVSQKQKTLKKEKGEKRLIITMDSYSRLYRYGEYLYRLISIGLG